MSVITFKNELLMKIQTDSQDIMSHPLAMDDKNRLHP